MPTKGQLRSQMRSANYHTKGDRIAWHQAMDKKFNRVFPSRRQRENGIGIDHRNTLVCPHRKW